MDRKGKNVGAIIIAVVASVLIIGLIVAKVIEKKATEVNVSKYDINTIIAGNNDNGHIGDHVDGDPNAPILIFEYADYQCSGCATAWPRMQKIIEEYEGKVAIVYRSFLLSYHQNGTAAASAAEAAGLQGYWFDYATRLFANQSIWANASGEERTEVFSDMFRTVTNGTGDEKKFISDMSSTDVKAKINFDVTIAKSLDIPGTPSFFLDGERIDFSSTKTEEEFLNLMREKINAKLASQ